MEAVGVWKQKGLWVPTKIREGRRGVGPSVIRQEQGQKTQFDSFRQTQGKQQKQAGVLREEEWQVSVELRDKCWNIWHDS